MFSNGKSHFAVILRRRPLLQNENWICSILQFFYLCVTPAAKSGFCSTAKSGLLQFSRSRSSNFVFSLVLPSFSLKLGQYSLDPIQTANYRARASKFKSECYLVNNIYKSVQNRPQLAWIVRLINCVDSFETKLANRETNCPYLYEFSIDRFVRQRQSNSLDEVFFTGERNVKHCVWRTAWSTKGSSHLEVDNGKIFRHFRIFRI